MRNKFDMQLELLNEQLTRMGELCELAINRVTKALVEGNLEQAKKVMAADEEIDQMEKDIERLCLKLLLQQQPVARDLRQISAALKMITDMERIGDQTADIAEIIISAGMSEAGDVKKIEEMSAGVARMVNDSVTAYVERDLELARKVMEADRHPASQWLDTATREIRFGPDRRAVRAELEAHLEDKALDLQRIFPDLPPEECRRRAEE